MKKKGVLSKLSNSISAVAAITALVGTAILAERPEALFVVFVFYGISNAAWIVHSIRRRETWLGIQNALFAVITVVGLLKHWP